MSLSPTCIPDHVLRLMSPADRKRLGKAGQTFAEAFAKSDAKNEHILQDQIAGLLRIRGIPFYQSRMDKKQNGTTGWPDFTLSVLCAKERGKPVLIEAKSPTGKLSKEQEALHPKLRASGWLVFVVRSVVEVQAILDDHT